jgi:hypothetical protein
LEMGQRATASNRHHRRSDIHHLDRFAVAVLLNTRLVDLGLAEGEGLKVMDDDDPFRDIDLNGAIGLRWSLRDIRARRWSMSPIKAAHMEKLLAMGLIEFQDEIPILTDAGLSAIA